MSEQVDLKELLGEERIVKQGKGRPVQFDKETMAARKREQSRRANREVDLVMRGLRRLHPEEWEALLAQAKAIVAAEAGPLPGDEV